MTTLLQKVIIEILKKYYKNIFYLKIETGEWDFSLSKNMKKEREIEKIYFPLLA